MTTAEKVEAIKEWIAENPLRKKRNQINASKDHASVLMGVAVSSIKTWEVGAHKPTEPSMERIADFLEVSKEEAQRIWDEWWKARPGRSERTDERIVTNGGRPY